MTIRQRLPHMATLSRPGEHWLASFAGIHTVNSHIRHILENLQLENRTQVAAHALQSRLVEPPAAAE